MQKHRFSNTFSIITFLLISCHLFFLLFSSNFIWILILFTEILWLFAYITSTKSIAYITNRINCPKSIKKILFSSTILIIFYSAFSGMSLLSFLLENVVSPYLPLLYLVISILISGSILGLHQKVLSSIR